ncbi:hypothetical protein L2W58_06465 [Dethiosulfovibrio sp. F2B]|uniref:hypothetical protein n=1 Tax=Dethiosulfovibrio faecalis TaxID=2720018 RepID=UPI001F2F8532|nr:hypothetical protein [Dethiosulfovibrio faecalis]MCF4151443.1 hypothetical protein [Dethiosulfovibrio faecalis]
MNRLPYWENDLDFEVSDLFPYDMDWRPVSVNRFCGDKMVGLAQGAMALGSEFIYVSGLGSGIAGTMTWDGDPEGMAGFSLGFTLMFGYSPAMEEVVSDVLEEGEESGDSALIAGVTECIFRSSSVPRGARKIIMMATPLPLKDEAGFIDDLLFAMGRHCSIDHLIPYYAEKFGFRRSSVPYETDDVMDLRIATVLHSFEMSETRNVVGPPPDVSMPPIFDFRLSLG